MTRVYGFHLEAVTLEESIMTDRLLSFLVRSGDIKPDTPSWKYSFGNLIATWIVSAKDPIPVKGLPDLREAVDHWRTRRNEMVHGMVKSMPGAHHQDVIDFLMEAAKIAAEGEDLARALSEWCDRQKRLARRTIASSGVSQPS